MGLGILQVQLYIGRKAKPVTDATVEIKKVVDGRTLAELSSDEKNQISSRKKALEAIKPHLTAFC